MNLKVVEKLQLGGLATPLPDRRRPVYNWFPIKEAFSRDLVGLLVETWGLREGDLILDQFCGVGTTPLACKEFGLDCMGFDVHPVLLFASRVKVRDHDVRKLNEAVRELVKSKFEWAEVEVPGFVGRVFPKPVLEDIKSFRRKIVGVDDETTREFMLLGLAVAAMRCSWAHKDGAAIKVVKRLVPPLRKALERQLLQMCRDLEQFEAKTSEVKVERCDARKLKLDDEIVDAVITSPPYLGKEEYIHAHRIEGWILGVEPHADFVSSEEKLYFKDMLAAIKETYRVCKPGANVCMVTSDGCSREGPVEVCVPLSELAEKVGFKAKRMVVVNRRFCTTPARKKVGVTREALLLWEK